MSKFFNSNRSNYGKGVPVATRIIRDTIRKGGKIDEEVFRKIVKAKLAEKMSGAGLGYGNQNFSMGIGKASKTTRSENAQKAIDAMNEAKLAKAKSKERKEVVIVARGFINGKINSKGLITDLAGNPVAQVNRKNGAMTTIYGQYFGIYQPKSFMTQNAIVDIINKNSPHLVNQRLMLVKQKQMEEQALRDANISSSSIGFDAWGNQPSAMTLGDIWGNRRTDIWGNPM